jgi:hypothetical protein
MPARDALPLSQTSGPLRIAAAEHHGPAERGAAGGKTRACGRARGAKQAVLAILLVISASVDAANNDAHQNLARAAKEFAERWCRVEALPATPALHVAPEAGCATLRR